MIRLDTLGRLNRSPSRFVRVLLLVISFLTLASVVSAGKPTCLQSADYSTINQLFSDGGPGTKVFLCPGKVYSLSGTIVFTAADQELATLGYPSGDERAKLTIEHEFIVTAVQGDCRRCARVAVRNLIIDGGRSRLGRAQGDVAPGLIMLGGNEGPSVRECQLMNPRGWTAIHIREGAKLQCKNALIERNEIGPSGEEYDPAVDGADPEMSPLGRPLADGISIACKDSIVRDNTIVDCTDAGIVVYCSPGTKVTANHISSVGLSAMGGILMVDPTPFDGDYSGVLIRDNILEATSKAMRVGIGIGLSILSDDIDTILRGGSVIHNELRGLFMGYGIAAAGLEGWKIEDNWTTARHQGKRSARCFEDLVNPEPMPFLYHKATVEKSTFQEDFEDHDFAYVVCIDGLEGTDDPLPEPIPEMEEMDEEDDTLSTGNEALDGILLHSQQSMIEAIGILGRRVDNALADAAGQGGAGDKRQSLGLDGETLDDIETRLDRLEHLHKVVLGSARGLHSQLKKMTSNMDEAHLWQSDVLLHIQQEFQEQARIPARAISEPTPQAETHSAVKQSGLPMPVYILAAILILGGLYRAFWHGRRTRHSKVV